MPTKPRPPLVTIRSAADYYGATIERVRYAVKSRAIAPKIIAGKTKIFHDADLERIGDALAEAASYNPSQRDEGEAPRV